jgi:hypothetical protein
MIDTKQVEIAGFLTGRTLFCGNVVGDLVSTNFTLLVLVLISQCSSSAMIAILLMHVLYHVAERHR